jgi:hypothetical protein
MRSPEEPEGCCRERETETRELELGAPQGRNPRNLLSTAERQVSLGRPLLVVVRTALGLLKGW